MKNTSVAFALVLSLAFGTAILLQPAQAQIRPGQIKVIGAAADYHLIHTSNYVYRFDSKTGATQRLMAVGSNPGVKWEWQPLLDSNPPTAGEPGKFEVVEGTGSSGILVRIDTASGKTWAAIQGNILHWEEATPK